uniref:Uncharacterized protein n=1 Tax=Rhizophora mucronata TaxID=61149 RepID=A0A2P2KT55_RHIMU
MISSVAGCRFHR